MAPLSFGLNLSKGASESRPSRAKGFGFADDDSDSEKEEASSSIEIATFDGEEQKRPSQSQQPTEKSAKSKKAPSGLDTPLGFSLSSKLKHTAVSAAAQNDDPSVFDYDAHYGSTSSAAADSRRRAAAKAEAETRTPKYVQNMASAAAVREKDQLRARDKVLQKEREAEGEEFADKEKFVTAAYKEQQAAARRVEEEEAKREEADAKSGKAMQNFWRGMMNEDEKRYKAESASAAPVEADVHKTADQETAERARELNSKGANIEINAEGQVADKRQLLTAGLNVVSKPKDDRPKAAESASKPSSATLGRSTDQRASREAMRERQSRMLADQLEAASKRRADEEAEELSKRERNAKSQKTEGEISSARERFLARKKEAAAAKARGEAP